MPDYGRDDDVGRPIDEQDEIAALLRSIADEDPYAEEREANEE